MSNSPQKGQVRFIRRGGRIIPIGVKREGQALNEITSGSQNRTSWGKIGLATVGAFASLYAAGRMGAHSDKLLSLGFKKSSDVFNRVAKITKFGGQSTAAIVAGREMASIDARSNDEKAQVFNIGNTTKSIAATASGVLGAYGAYRIGKRFEYAGKLGKNLTKLKDIKSMIKLRAI